jgi:anti-repressor protein
MAEVDGMVCGSAVGGSMPTVFEFEGNSVRVVLRDGEPWWVLADVCKVLGVQNSSAVAERLDDNERSRLNLGRQGEVNIINESGLYEVIFQSRKPEAKRFQKWVFEEVLPAIRKTGAYGQIKPMSDLELAEWNVKLIKERNALAVENKALDDKGKALEAENEKLVSNIEKALEVLTDEEFKNKVKTAGMLNRSDAALLDVNNSAQVLNFKVEGVEIGQKTLNKLFRVWGLIQIKGTVPLQAAKDKGLLVSQTTAYDHPDGHGGTHKDLSTKGVFTGKGLSYVINRGVAEGYLDSNTNVQERVDSIVRLLTEISDDKSGHRLVTYHNLDKLAKYRKLYS